MIRSIAWPKCCTTCWRTALALPWTSPRLTSLVPATRLLKEGLQRLGAFHLLICAETLIDEDLPQRPKGPGKQQVSSQYCTGRRQMMPLRIASLVDHWGFPASPRLDFPWGNIVIM